MHGQTDPLLGTLIDPDAYDYRGQALDLIFFAKTLDRFWQNYRRATGRMLAYAGAVEMQRRLATHAHFLVRGTVPRGADQAGRGGHLLPGLVAQPRPGGVHSGQAAGVG